MAEQVLFYAHIPKNGGKGIRAVFDKLGYECNLVCTKHCGHSNNTVENHAVLDQDFSPEESTFCKEAVREIINTQGVMNVLVHHVFPRKKHKNDYIIASIRNPYALMVSRWKYHDQFFPDQYSFEEWIHEYHGENLMRFVECCFENGNCTKPMIVDYFIRLEHIEQDINYLIDEGILQTGCSKENIHQLCREKHNTTEHGHFSGYYSQELKDVVYNSSKPIFDMFGYKR